MPAALPSDEELIPRSLMACVDAQADADPDQTPNFKNAHLRHRQTFHNPPFPAFHPPLQLSSQTPYGPHVPQQQQHQLSQPNQHVPEEISTIFVVGFPEDMQEREFQNMFTFSAGFEAATLKIPNKDYPPYQPPPQLNGIRPPFQQHYPVAEPYAIMGPPVPEPPRDGMWPPDHDIGTMTLGFPSHPHAAPLPQRKQIIGFAKFRSRDEALAARDALQGKRVDIEKGAVLKAEMAKKNLHTKRGVGPVALSTTFPPISQPSAQHPPPNGIHDHKDHHWHHQGSDSTSTNPEDYKMNLVLNSGLASLSLGAPAGGPRGPRERAEEEERERRRRVEETAAKEINLMRLRATNTAAFDAFHSVPAGPTNMSRQNSSGFGSNGNSTSRDSPNLAFAEAQHDQSDVVGPWDRVNPSMAIPIPPPARPRSTSQDSSSPFSVHAPPQQTPYENNVHHAYQPYRTHSESSQTSASVDSANGLAPIGSGLYIQGPSSSNGDTLVAGALRASTSESLLGSGSLASGQQTPNVPHPGSAGGTGNTSPTLPSPAGSSNGSNGTTTSGDRPANGGPRGTIDQNPPINTLYIGNLPTSPPPPGYQQDSLEEHLREAFQQRPGFRKLCFRHKPNGPMCFVEFEDVHYATKAMQEMSGNTLRGLVKNGIRLSYSKNPLGVRTPTSAGANGGMQQQQQLAAANNNQFHQFHPMQTHDSFQTRLADEFPRVVPPTILRRENSGLLPPIAVGPSSTQTVVVPPPPPPPPSTMLNGSGVFMPSPPPRFFSTSTGGANVIGTTPLTGASNAFIPRGMMMIGGASGGPLSSVATSNGVYGSVSANVTASGLPVPEGGNTNGSSS